MEHQKQGVRIGFESLPLLNYRRNLGNDHGAAFLASDDAQWLSGLAIPVGGGGMAGNWRPNRDYPLTFASSFIGNRQPDYVRKPD
jgi:hypothetical protein